MSLAETHLEKKKQM